MPGLGSRALSVATAPDVVELFRACGERWGLPASVLTDNGCIYTAWHRGGYCMMESEMLALGIVYKHSRPTIRKPVARWSVSTRP